MTFFLTCMSLFLFQQVCQNDISFFSYADIPIKCTKDSVDYNVLEAAQIVAPSDRLRESLGFVDG
jgi:hypothetical protein